jgi:hypothetical protein
MECYLFIQVDFAYIVKFSFSYKSVGKARARIRVNVSLRVFVDIYLQ